jgi:hypothetical protein
MDNVLYLSYNNGVWWSQCPCQEALEGTFEAPVRRDSIPVNRDPAR